MHPPEGPRSGRAPPAAAALPVRGAAARPGPPRSPGAGRGRPASISRRRPRPARLDLPAPAAPHVPRLDPARGRAPACRAFRRDPKRAAGTAAIPPIPPPGIRGREAARPAAYSCSGRELRVSFFPTVSRTRPCATLIALPRNLSGHCTCPFSTGASLRSAFATVPSLPSASPSRVFLPWCWMAGLRYKLSRSASSVGKPLLWAGGPPARPPARGRILPIRAVRASGQPLRHPGPPAGRVPAPARAVGAAKSGCLRAMHPPEGPRSGRAPPAAAADPPRSPGAARRRSPAPVPARQVP